MRPEPETVAALRRAGRRALVHLVKASIEGLRAVEAVFDELSRVGRASQPPDDDRPVRIELE
ncbi:MAG: hypothetical protein ACRDVM_07525 [Acidimicrobiia bacterium]